MHFGAPMLLEKRELLFGFDAFSDDMYFQAFSKCNDCFNDVRTFVCDADLAHERTIDFDLIECERLKSKQ